MRKFIVALTACAFLSACASSAQDVDAAYVSPMQYGSYDCGQIRSEMMRVARKVNELSGVQDSQHTKDSVALGVGLIVFWPALFFMIGHDKHQELAEMKGEYDALEQTAIQKKCKVAKEIAAAQAMQSKRLKKQEDAAKRSAQSTNE